MVRGAIGIALALALVVGTGLGERDAEARGKRPRARPLPTAKAQSKARAARPAKLEAVALPSDPAAVAALGQAWTAYQAGDFVRARALAAPLAHARLLAKDHAAYIAAQAAFFAGDRKTALAAFRELAARKGSRFAAGAAWRIADCLFELGRTDDARARYAALLGKPGGDDGVAHFRIALADAEAARTSRAHAGWRRLVVDLPAHPLADAALERLAAAGAPPLDAAERITRAHALTRARRWTDALAELALVPDNVPAGVRTRRDFALGTTLFKMRRQYARAGELLLSVHERMGARAAEALFHGARALSRANRDDEAIRWYREVVRKYPRSPQAAEAQFLTGWLEFNRSRPRDALAPLTATLAKYGRSEWADDAIWFLGFSHFLLGEHAAALARFDELARKGGELVGGKGRYWRARSLDALARPDEATTELRQLVGRYPLSWYALLARARLTERGVTVGPFGDATHPRAPLLGAVDPALAHTPLLALADELVAAGLGTLASDELRRGESTFLRQHGSARALPALLARYLAAGDFRRPYVLAEGYGRAALGQPPDGDARAWWEHAYPRAYRTEVERHESLGKNPPYYLYAIMRKESGFNPHDVSYADAIGLMQMIPPTTRRVAATLGLTYDDDLLYDPDKNLQVASWYIGQLGQKFRGQIPFAAGSYNGGPRPIMRWLDQYGDRPLDEVVELAAYTQTREYMKKVTAIYARYLALYAGEDYAQPLTVDRAWRTDGPDY